jgi:hypothetical protein
METLIINPPGITVRPSSDRYAIAQNFEDIVERIHAQPGFERFLRAVIEEEFKVLAQFDPIIIFNMAEIRSDAFLVTTNGVSCLYLI